MNLRTALTSSRHALEERFDTNDVAPERYGNTFLFFYFLKQTCDADQVWKNFFKIPASTNQGRDSVQHVLRQLNSPVQECGDVKELMSKFIVSKLVNLKGGGMTSALWPQLQPMSPMSAEARTLAGLSFTDQRKFLEALPPFLGLKLPLGIWVPTLGPQVLSRLGIKIQVWQAGLPYPTLRDWEGERLPPTANSYLLLYKAR